MISCESPVLYHVCTDFPSVTDQGLFSWSEHCNFVAWSTVTLNTFHGEEAKAFGRFHYQPPTMLERPFDLRADQPPRNFDLVPMAMHELTLHPAASLQGLAP